MITDSNAHFTAFEQVYTSARQLLGTFHGDLGVVRETIGFPDEVRSDLERLNSYQVLDRAIHGSDSPPPAYFLATCGGNGKYYIISRTVFAGADHTGRSNPLGHHFVVPKDQASGELTLHDILAALRPKFLWQWKAVPDRPVKLHVLCGSATPHKSTPLPSGAWAKFVEHRRISALLGFVAEFLTSPKSNKDSAVVFVVPDSLGDDVADLVGDILQVIPPYAASDVSIRTHVLTTPGIAGQCRVMFTYKDTEYLLQQRKRLDPARPVIIDLTNQSYTPPPVHDFGARIRDSILNRGPTGETARLVRTRNLMGPISDASETPFCDFLSLQVRLSRKNALGDVSATLASIRQVAQASKTAEASVARQLHTCIVEHVNARKGASDWNQLVLVAFCPYSPAQCRESARKAIDRLFCYAVPSLAELMNSAQIDEASCRTAVQNTLERPGIITQVLRLANNSGKPEYVRKLCRLLLDAKPVINLDELLSWYSSHPEQGNSQDIHQLICRYIAFIIEQHVCTPMQVAQAFAVRSVTVGQQEKHTILFAILEATGDATTLMQVTAFLQKELGNSDELLPGYDISRHSKRVMLAIQSHGTPNNLPQVPISCDSNFGSGEHPEWPTLPRKSRSRICRGTPKPLPSSFQWFAEACGGVLPAWFRVSTLLAFGCVVVLIPMKLRLRPEEFKDFAFPSRIWVALSTIHETTPGPTLMEKLGLCVFPILISVCFGCSLATWSNKDPRRRDSRIFYWGVSVVGTVLGAFITVTAAFFWLSR